MVLNLLSQLLIGRHLRLVFGGKQLLAAVENGVAGNIRVGFGTQHDANGGIVAFGEFQLVEHTAVHIHLPDILVRDFADFEVYEHIAFEHYIIEYKVYIIVARFWANKVR